MIRVVGEIAIAIGGSLVLSLIVKATIVSAAALTAARIATRTRAAVRHVLLASSFVLLLTLPVVSLAVPARHVGIPVLQAPPAPAATLASPAPEASVSPSSNDIPVPSVSRTGKWPSPMSVVLVAWLAGVVVMLVNIVGGFVRVRRLRSCARPFHRGQALVAEIAAATTIRRQVRVLVDDTVGGPITCGVIRPAMVFPADAHAWRSEELRRAVIHELEHIRRADWLLLCVARIVCALYWFHPLVWISWRRLRVEAERACDDAVLLDSKPEVYADQLVTLAERLTFSRTESVPAMANRFDLATRVSAVLDAQQRRGPAGIRWVASVSVVAVVLVAVIAPLRAAPVPQIKGAPLEFKGAFLTVTPPTPVVSGPAPSTRAERFLAPRLERQVSTNLTAPFSPTSSDPAERAAAACRLGIAGDRSAVPQLIALLDDGAPLPPQVFCGTDPPFEDETWAPVQDVFEPSPGEAATRALLAIGDAAIEPLTDTLLSASHWRARKNAAWALAHRGNAVAALKTALNDPAWQVRAEAAYALFHRGSNVRDVVDALAVAVEDRAWPVREQAVLALGSQGRRGTEVTESLLVALRDEHPRVRAAATTSLWHSADRRAWDALFASLGDADSGVRAGAARAVGNRASDADIQLLIAARNDSDPRIREGVDQALRIVNERMRGTTTNLTRVEIPRD